MTRKLNTLGVCAVTGLMVIATSVSASITEQTVVTPYQYTKLDFAFQYAQSGSFADLRPSSVRRLRYYSDQAITALLTLANEDIAAGDDGAGINSNTTDVLRSAIERLIGAGEKVDLSLEQTAAFFTEESRTWFSADPPFILQDAQGNLDALVLFQGVAMSSLQTSASQTDAAADYLKMVITAGVDAQGSSPGLANTPTAAPAAPVVETAVEEVSRPPEVQAYWDRLVTVDGVSTITVRRGDSLATYAANFYQDALQYRTIFAANGDILRTPNFLEVGQVITIPGL